MDYNETKIGEGLHELVKHRLTLLEEDIRNHPGNRAHNVREYIGKDIRLSSNSQRQNVEILTSLIIITFFVSHLTSLMLDNIQKNSDNWLSNLIKQREEL